MKLEKFRITNYKTIEDSGWITLDEVTALVGKNESGKTSLLRALSKLNPTDGAELDSLRDFPRQRYTKDFAREDWKAIEASFEIPADLKATFISWHRAFERVKSVTFHKYYSGDLKYSLNPWPEFPAADIEDWTALLKLAKKTIERVSLKGLDESEIVSTSKIRDEIAIKIDAILDKNEASSANIKSLKAIIIDAADRLPELAKKDEILDQIDGFDEIVKTETLNSKAYAELKTKLPKFIYFDNYEMINGAIFLPDFIRKVKEKRVEQGIRVQKAIFSQVNADIEDLATLSKSVVYVDPSQAQTEEPDKQRKIRELTIKANSAGDALTKDFNEWWKEGGYKFHYEFNGNYFEIWVSDGIQPSKIELSERSAGFRYFFSFFLLFSVEAKDMHNNCILLLDEPGTHLHGRAQMDLIEFFDKLANENQLIYSTHSPFMIDGSRLERSRAVVKNQAGTKVSSDIWPKDKDSVFALQGALGYSICQSLFISKFQLLVEGPSDYLLLHAINSALEEDKRLKETISMIPIGGCSNLVPYSSLLLGHDVEFFVILDSDAPAKSATDKLVRLLGDKSRISSYSDLMNDESITELEEILPASEYIKAVNSSHSHLGITVPELPLGIKIIEHCKTTLKKSGHQLNKLDVTRELIRRLSLKSDPVKAPLLAFGEKAFKKINIVL
jgi:energy-coupling factor transporter ATP-binding protein EcfA2